MRKNKYKGRLILLAGLDGSGKTTAAKSLVKQLGYQYHLVYCKGVGSDTILGKLAKRFAKTTLFLLEVLCATIFPIRSALKNDKTVILDKYFFVVASHIPEVETGLNRLMISLFRPVMIRPDLIVYFKVSFDERARRLKNGPYNKFHQRIIDNREWAIEREGSYIKLLEQAG